MFASAQAGSATVGSNIEDVFATHLYEGTGGVQTINNGINLNLSGGLVWIKRRDSTEDHYLFDTIRGVNQELNSNTTDASTALANSLTSFNTNGFTLGAATGVNTSGGIYTAWTFKEQFKFFDMVTYTGNGTARTIPHSLGAVPGCIIIKKINGTSGGAVYHDQLGTNEYLALNSNANKATSANVYSAVPTSSVFSIGTDGIVNANGDTYVAYLFARNTNGFGPAGNDGVVFCGSYTGNASTSGPSVTLGWEPQWLLVKCADTYSQNWVMYDNFRALSNDLSSQLEPNTNAAETSAAAYFRLNATGFQVKSTATQVNGNAAQFVFIAIRRGPMRPPVIGTSVFVPSVYTGTNVDNRLVTTTIAPDVVWMRQRNDNVLAGMVVASRLRGQPYVLTGSLNAEASAADAFDQQLQGGTEYGNAFSAMNGVWVGNDATAKLNVNTQVGNHIVEAFKRAPEFFDSLIYTGTGSVADGMPNNYSVIPHNLRTPPELVIYKDMSVGGTQFWPVYCKEIGVANFLNLNSNIASTGVGTEWWAINSTTRASPDASNLYIGPAVQLNLLSSRFLVMMFASASNVSRVGSYTGNGATLSVDCGFTTGARFVLIKRTNASGNWYIWDSARGIVSANDPWLITNGTSAEVSSDDSIDVFSGGFYVNQKVATNVNVLNGTYIFLAIA
jgi:hypothetical protein